jgi:hypothetical protein
MRMSRTMGCALLCAVLLAGCGGGLTHAEYVQRVNAICGRFNDQQKALAQPSSPAEIPGYVDQIIPAFTAEIAAISAVKPPKADKPKVDQMLSDVRSAIPALQKLKTAAQQGDQATFNSTGQQLDQLNTKVNDTATSIGLTTCAQS